MRGVQRLQHVVAGGGEEPGLGQVRLFGGFLGGDQIDVGLFQPPQGRMQFLSAACAMRFSRLIAVWNSEKALPCWSIERSTRLISAALIFFSRSSVVDVLSGTVDRSYSAAWRSPKAMPVKVWFRCIGRYCSP